MANKQKFNSAIASTTIKEDATLPPILRWAGGKRSHHWLFEAIAKVFNPHKNRLVEPFVGGAAIALGVDPKWALLNDANPYLIDLYQAIKSGEIESNCFENGVLTDSQAYYDVREAFNKEHEPLMFYYLNRTGFNGLCRFSQKGKYNVPYGNLPSPKLDHNFEAYQAKFEDWVFTSMDFADMQIFPHDVVVADPPYDVAEGKNDHDYVAGGFGWADQVRLANWLASHKVPVFACNLATDRIVDLYTALGFDIQVVEAPRAIACNGDRQKVKEILATKNLEATT